MRTTKRFPKYRGKTHLNVGGAATALAACGQVRSRSHSRNLQFVTCHRCLPTWYVPSSGTRLRLRPDPAAEAA